LRIFSRKTFSKFWRIFPWKFSDIFEDISRKKKIRQFFEDFFLKNFPAIFRRFGPEKTFFKILRLFLWKLSKIFFSLISRFYVPKTFRKKFPKFSRSFFPKKNLSEMTQNFHNFLILDGIVNSSMIHFSIQTVEFNPNQFNFLKTLLSLNKMLHPNTLLE
jgi:hypothetical protein